MLQDDYTLAGQLIRLRAGLLIGLSCDCKNCTFAEGTHQLQLAQKINKMEKAKPGVITIKFASDSQVIDSVIQNDLNIAYADRDCFIKQIHSAQTHLAKLIDIFLDKAPFGLSHRVGMLNEVYGAINSILAALIITNPANYQDVVKDLLESSINKMKKTAEFALYSK